MFLVNPSTSIFILANFPAIASIWSLGSLTFLSALLASGFVIPPVTVGFAFSVILEKEVEGGIQFSLFASDLYVGQEERVVVAIDGCVWGWRRT